MVCDGAYTNLSTMKHLECVMDGGNEELKCWFSHPVNDQKVCFLPDACHNLKLARNTLRNCKCIESNKGNFKWAYILNLHIVQNEITFKFSNKISAAHVHWYNNKMKVKYAAQTLSSSTADALEYLNKTSITGFSDIKATVEYCRFVDRKFDFLNSKSSFSKGLKFPIFRNNINCLKIIITPLIEYLYSLK